MDNQGGYWDEKLREATFPVKLTPVYAENPSNKKLCRVQRFRAIMPGDDRDRPQPYAVVTNHYQLITNETVVHLARTVFDNVFFETGDVLRVLLVALAEGGGSFFADFTASEYDHPDICRSIHVPDPSDGRSGRGADPETHQFFLRAVNSYNRAQAVRFDVGVLWTARDMCQNGMIVSKSSIRFRNPHNKSQHELKKGIIKNAELFDMDAFQKSLSNVYMLDLHPDICVLEGALQVLQLRIPPIDTDTHLPRVLRCQALMQCCEQYENSFGRKAFSALQAASEWARKHSLGFHRYGYERRCGEMLENLESDGRWPGRDYEARRSMTNILAKFQPDHYGQG